jgi:hypothetical protein
MRLPILLCCTTALTTWSTEVVCHREGYVTRRGTVSRKSAEAQQRKPTRPKRSNAAMAARNANSALSELQKQLKSQVRELEEAPAFARPIRQGSVCPKSDVLQFAARKGREGIRKEARCAAAGRAGRGRCPASNLSGRPLAGHIAAPGNAGSSPMSRMSC